MANKAFQLGGLGSRCCCTGGGCTISICCNFTCNEVVLPAGSITVDVYTFPGGVLAATGVTSAVDGCVHFTTLTAGNYEVTTSGNARYGDTDDIYDLECGAGATISLSPADGYHCSPCFKAPIPDTLTFTGGGTSLTIDATTDFIFSPTVANYLDWTTGNCSGSIMANPCMIGSSAVDVQIFFEDGTGITAPCPTGCTVLMRFVAASDCTLTTCTGATFSAYLDWPFGGGFTGLWVDPGPGTPCRGTCSQQDISCAEFGSGLDVPVNLSLTFGNGVNHGRTPPFTAITITE